jgi:hypothetical protein
MLGSFQIWINRKSDKKSMEGKFVNSHVLRLICQWVTNVIDLAGLGDAMEITAERSEQSA